MVFKTNDTSCKGGNVHFLDRDELMFSDGESGRIYFCINDGCDTIVPSTTTVLGRRDDPEKDNAIKWWKKHNDGSKGNADHLHLFKYSGWRGTLAHWNILNYLSPDGLEIGDEEEESWNAIDYFSTDYEWVFSVLKNRAKYRNNQSEFDDTFPSTDEYDHRTHPTLRKTVSEDLGWVTKTFFNHVDELGLANVGYDESDCGTVSKYVSTHLRSENIVNVEQYIPTTNDFSGQYDLIFQKPNGETVLCDLKTSSAIRWSHQCQSVAYAHSVDRPIDDLCIVRIHPDSKEVEIMWESDFDESRSSYMDTFFSLRDKVVRLVNEFDTDTDIDVDSNTVEATA